jgi:hypothetical protein
MRVLVCGAMYFTDYEKLHDELVKIFHQREIHNPIIISGMAKGADTLAVKFAEQYSYECLKFPADWAKYGKGAGPVRNQQMLDEGSPDLIVAFPMQSSVGTRDMIKRGMMEDVEVIVIEV